MVVTSSPPRSSGIARARIALIAVMVAAGIAALTSSAVVQINHVGVYHDELWNYPAAVALARGQSILPHLEVNVLGRPLPLVSGPYQGALKSWLAAPVLGGLGTSVAVLRGLNVVLAIVYLLSLAWALAPWLGWASVPVFFALPLLDPTFLIFVPTDQGPFLLQSLFIAIACGALLRLKGDTPHLLVVATGATSLAVADKLTVLPFALAFTVVAAATALSLGRRYLRWTILPGLAAAALVPLVPHTLYFVRIGFSDLFSMVAVDDPARRPYLDRLATIAGGFFGEFFNRNHMAFALTNVAPTGTPGLSLALVGVALLAAPLAIHAFRLASGSARWPPEREVVLLPALFLGTLLAMALFNGLNRPWHFFILHPILALGAVLAAALSARLMVATPARLAARLILGIVAVTLMASGLSRGISHIAHIERYGGSAITSTAINDASRTLSELKARRVVCLSYSLCSCLYVLSNGAFEIVDLAFARFTADDSALIEGYLNEPGTYLIYRYSTGETRVPAAQLEFLNRGSIWFMTSPFARDATLPRMTHADARGTEFVLVGRSATRPSAEALARSMRAG
jgi:hypothetical protein